MRAGPPPTLINSLAFPEAPRWHAGVRLTTLAELDALASFHCDDMVVDRLGRAYVDNFGFDMFVKAPAQPARLILVTPDGNTRVVTRDLLFPNGCVIPPDQITLIVAEIFGRRWTALDIAADGLLNNRRVWAVLPDVPPDDICLDVENSIWVASPPISEFLDMREDGEIAERISVQNQAIACALGGPYRHTPYMVTGRVSHRERGKSESDALKRSGSPYRFRKNRVNRKGR